MGESLASLIKREKPASVPGTKCHVGLALNTLSPRDRKTALTAIDDPAVASSTLTRALQALGCDLGQDSMRKHRRYECKCRPRP